MTPGMDSETPSISTGAPNGWPRRFYDMASTTLTLASGCF